MVLPLLILLISLGLASSSSDEGACLTIQNDVDYLRRAELALGCCDGRDCRQQDVDNNNNNCHSLAQEKLEPCLRNSNISCLAANLGDLKTYPNSPCFESSQICQSLENMRTSLLEKRNLICPPEEILETSAKRQKRTVVCEALCVATCGSAFVPCLIGGPLAWGLCTGTCATCIAAALANPFC